MRTTEATKCGTCEGQQTITEWELDENDTAHQVTTECDDCNGTGIWEPMTSEELAEQARGTEARREAARNAHRHIEMVCRPGSCRWER